MELWSIIGILSVGIVAYKFTMQLGKGLPILELMILIAGLQWIVGPLIEYASPSMHYKYYMYVEQAIYMGYIVPAYVVFSGIIFIGVKRMSMYQLGLDQLVYYSKFGIYLLVIGVVYDFLSDALSFLGFLGYIISNFKYVGAIILYFSPNKKLRRLFYFVILFLLYRSLAMAMFHDFILWSVFFYMFWAYKFKPSIKTKLSTYALAAVLIVSLQTVKAAYRSEVWAGYSGNKVELFTGLMYDALLGDSTGLGDGVGTNVRLNQGWIISAIMDHVPSNRDFFAGTTISEALKASVLPRFLDPEKAKAGGQENFRKFTGLQIGDGTSMGISIVGEGYGNFGVMGGILFMGIWGFVVLQIWKYLMRKSAKKVLLLAFLPLIFLQVIKAETELLVVLNHLVKSLIVVLLFLWITKSVWSVKPVYEL